MHQEALLKYKNVENQFVLALIPFYNHFNSANKDNLTVAITFLFGRFEKIVMQSFAVTFASKMFYNMFFVFCSFFKNSMFFRLRSIN